MTRESGNNMGMVALARVVLWSTCGLMTMACSDTEPTSPPIAGIVSADIVEREPLDSSVVPDADRSVILRIELDKTPTCDADAPASFGFLIDSDNDPESGVREEFTEPLGVDARLVIECSGDTLALSSELGPVTVTSKNDGGAAIEVAASLGALPSVDFRWIAYVHREGRLARLPGRGQSARWSVAELTLN